MKAQEKGRQDIFVNAAASATRVPDWKCSKQFFKGCAFLQSELENSSEYVCVYNSDAIAAAVVEE